MRHYFCEYVTIPLVGPKKKYVCFRSTDPKILLPTLTFFYAKKNNRSTKSGSISVSVFVSDFNNRNKEWRIHTSDNKNIVLEGEEVGVEAFQHSPNDQNCYPRYNDTCLN